MSLFITCPVESVERATAFYTALGFVAVGELGDDGLPEPLQFEISVGLRVMLIPSHGFGWVIGGRSVVANDRRRLRMSVWS